jgi:drug/metabolite transporter (DMT)-like permease
MIMVGCMRLAHERHHDHGRAWVTGRVRVADRVRVAGRPLLEGRPLLAAGLGAACISASAVLVKLSATGTATAAFYRCFLALPVLVALAVAEQRRRGPRRPSAHAGAFAAGGFLAIDLVLWNHTIADVGAGVATVLGNLQVLFITAAAWLLLRERPGRRFLFALPVVMGGVVLVSGLAGAGTGGGDPLGGAVYGIGTSIAYAAFLLILRQTSAGTPHVAGPLAEATAGAALGSLLLGLVFGGLQLDVPWPSLRWLLVLSITSQTVGWLLITSSLPRLPAAISSLLLLLQPVAAMALAAAVLGERPSAAQLAGAVLVCIGVLAVARNAAPAGGRPDRDPQPPGIPPADTERSTVAGPASTGSALPAETSG